ncbi:MAG: response regulator transcription factor [Motiliproteus sp.]|nr:response regulator transcription factor [Motiliproteus sp.]MCW9050855.1 response regulator transcription factor [Motiliproteus sp.]
MKILLADDHGVVRQGYGSLLSAMFSPVIIVEAANGTEAALQYHREQPDIMILDINMPDINGIEVARQIIASQPQARILMFSMYEEVAMVQRAFEAGALGYISKTSAPEVMVEAVKAIQAGERYLEPKLAAMLDSDPGSGIEEGAIDQLAPREREIFKLLVQGLNNQQIAGRLGISAKTVANRATTIKQKLGVRTSAELVHVAISNGWRVV